MSQKLAIEDGWIEQQPNRILVVDDDPGVLELLKLTLESDGHVVSTAATAGEAFDHIERAVAHQRSTSAAAADEAAAQAPSNSQGAGQSNASASPGTGAPATPATPGTGAPVAPATPGAGDSSRAPQDQSGTDVPSPAASGADSIAIFPDLVLLDINLPDANGVEVCQALRQRDSCERLPVILISADATEDMRVNGLAAGANDFIAKPFYPRELLAKVYRCLESTHETQRLEQQTTELVEANEQVRVDLTRTERELKKQLYSNQTLISLCQQLAGSLKLDDLLNTFMLMVLGQLGARAVAIFMPADNASSVLLPRVTKGVSIDKLSGICINVYEELGKYLLEKEGPASLYKLSFRPGFKVAVEGMRREGFELIDPVMIDDRLAVVVLIGSPINEREYDAADHEIFDALCKTAGVAIENAKLFSELRETCLGIIRTLLSTLEAKDSYTRGHTERVAMYSTCMAEQLGVTGDGLEDIRFGATLHDVGKLGIMDNVLKKPGALDRDERVHIMSHPSRGAAILEGLRFLEPAVDMVLHHHEALDGSGYPDGLQGDEISLGARIVAVADAFDAMTSGRAYMKAMAVGTAIQNLRKRAGQQFDGDVIDALEEVIQNGKISLGI